jgi:hypothetical protein
MEILYIILGLLIVWLGVSIYIVKNLLAKLEKFEDFTEEFNVELYKVDDALKAIDSKGSFRADDEIGFYFDEIKKLQDHLNKFKLK